jgi:hypothetical protein
MGDFVARVTEEVTRTGGDLDHIAPTDAQNVATPQRNLSSPLDPRHPLDLLGVEVLREEPPGARNQSRRTASSSVGWKALLSPVTGFSTYAVVTLCVAKARPD